MADTTSVKFLRDHESYTAGQVVDVPTSDAEHLIADGAAVATEPASPAAGQPARVATTGQPAAQSGLTAGEGRDINKPGWSNSPPAEQQDGVKGQAARKAGTAGPGAEKPGR